MIIEVILATTLTTFVIGDKLPTTKIVESTSEHVLEGPCTDAAITEMKTTIERTRIAKIIRITCRNV
jgi:hypothetical protein